LLNRELRRIFESNRDEVTGEGRKLHKEERKDMYSSPNILQVITLRRMIWDWHVARTGDRRCVYTVLVENPEGKSPLGRPSHRGKIILR